MDAAKTTVDTTELERRLAQLEAATRGDGAPGPTGDLVPAPTDEQGGEAPWAEALARVHGASASSRPGTAR